jgi:hypothetical protein
MLDEETKYHNAFKNLKKHAVTLLSQGVHPSRSIQSYELAAALINIETKYFKCGLKSNIVFDKKYLLNDITNAISKIESKEIKEIKREIILGSLLEEDYFLKIFSNF